MTKSHISLKISQVCYLKKPLARGAGDIPILWSHHKQTHRLMFLQWISDYALRTPDLVRTWM